jgi:hypothetical protein
MSICWANARSHGRRVEPAYSRNKGPVDSNNPLVRETFQRFWKNQISRVLSFLETNDSKVCAALAFLDRHEPIVLYLRLEMTIGGRLLPKSVNLRLPALFDHLGKTSRFDFEQFHCGSDRRLRSDAPYRSKSPPENYGKEDHTTVAAFLPWRDL